MKKTYVNLETLKSKIRELIDEVAKDFENEPCFDLLSIADDDECEMLAEYHANKINNDMEVYMHRDDTRIIGNFNNIRRDYERYNEGMYYKDLLKRLDEGATDEQTNADREWITDWFWDTFGTWGFKYNLTEQIDNELCALETETAD